MKCPHCGKTITGRTLAKALGSRTSDKKAASSAENGKLGGRPKLRANSLPSEADKP